MKINKNVLETIGKTPLIQINKLTKGANATVVAKMEARNPGGSVKDRICKSMIEEAEKQGSQTRRHLDRAYLAATQASAWPW